MTYTPKWNPPSHNPRMCTYSKKCGIKCKHSRKGHSFIKSTEDIIGCDDICDHNKDGLPCVSTEKPMVPCQFEGCTEMIEYKPNKKYCQPHKIQIKCELNNKFSTRYRKRKKEKVSA